MEIFIEHTWKGMRFVSATDEYENKLKIRESLIQRCVFLRETRKDDCESELPMKETMQDARSWLRCARFCRKDEEAGALVNEAVGTLVGAMKVSNAMQQRSQYIVLSLCLRL